MCTNWLSTQAHAYCISAEIVKLKKLFYIMAHENCEVPTSNVSRVQRMILSGAHHKTNRSTRKCHTCEHLYNRKLHSVTKSMHKVGLWSKHKVKLPQIVHEVYGLTNIIKMRSTSVPMTQMTLEVSVWTCYVLFNVVILWAEI